MPKRMPITSIDLDMTDDCCLRCDYCFRGAKARRYLDYETGTRALDWLIEQSQDQKSLSVSLFGGEPLMQFDLIKKLVPYGKRKAAYHGKRMHFGATTNSVLVTDDVIQFFQQYAIKPHTSIDGGRISHDKHRHFPNGKGSWDLIIPKIKKILSIWPDTTARATICNDNLERWFEDTMELVSLGYKNLAMILVPEDEWTDEHWLIAEREARKISDFYIDRCRQGDPIYIKHIEDAVRGIVNPQRRKHHCGAGRGNVLVKTDGTLYPCHRFGGEGASPENCLGSIFGELDQTKRDLFLNFDCRVQIKADCENCLAVHICGVSCIAVNWHMFKDIFTPPATHCQMMRLFFKEAMRVHYLLRSENNAQFMKKFYNQSGNRSDNGNKRNKNAPQNNSAKKSMNSNVVETRRAQPSEAVKLAV